MHTKFVRGIIIAIMIVSLPVISRAQTTRTVQVTLDSDVTDKPVTGRVLVFFSKRSSQPMNGPSWFSPEPFFAANVVDLKPGDSVTIDDTADKLRQPLSDLPDGDYTVQAVLDHDFYYASHSKGPGNFYSKPLEITVAEDQPVEPIDLTLDQVIEGPKYSDSKFVKFVEIESTLLGDFHGRQVLERAMVVLPPGYFETPDKRYPVYVVITGFGATLDRLQRRWRDGQPEPADDETEFIRVYLTGQCKWGHHVYANSATNGPRGDMLVRELIPAIDRKFRTISESTARFVGGHSSGGWSSLWLQVTYPDSFGGVWSTAPDPVDFRDWQGTNIYEEAANVYFDLEQEKRPLARAGERVLIHYQDFTNMDDVMGRGGQIRSFDAVFSPLDEEGLPVYCWDRKTGIVNPEALEHWKQYDISLKLKENWSELGPKLESKLHVYMGDTDTFYLEGATILLGERLKQLGSDAVVEIFPGKNHGNLLNAELRSRINREMTTQFRKNHPVDQ